MPNNLKIQIEDGVQVMFSDTEHMLEDLPSLCILLKMERNSSYLHGRYR